MENAIINSVGEWLESVNNLAWLEARTENASRVLWEDKLWHLSNFEDAYFSEELECRIENKNPKNLYLPSSTQ